MPASAKSEALELAESVKIDPHARELEGLQGRINRLQTKLTQQRAVERALRDKYETLKAQAGIADAAGAPTVTKIRPRKGTKGTEATVFMVASDWHVEEIVDPETVNGLNEYDSRISKRRAERFFVNGHRLYEIIAHDVKVRTIVLPLLGDFLTNHLHDDNPESNDRLPMEAIIQAQGYLASGIRFLLENTDCNLLVPCHSGNHGRTTRHVHSGTEHGHSLEFFMYKNLEQFFASEKRVKFEVGTAYHSFVDVYGFTVRLHHGHAIRYGGGVGGIYIPVNKAIAQWNKAKDADLDVFGHFHQMRDGGNFVSNGSLIGWSPYGVRIKADFEPPRQAFFVIDNKRGKTFTAPIIVEES